MASYQLNLIGYVCPVPLLKTKEQFAKLQVGEKLLVDTEHPRAVRNILDWACREGHIIDIEDKENGLWQITLQKR